MSFLPETWKNISYQAMSLPLREALQTDSVHTNISLGWKGLPYGSATGLDIKY